MLSRAWRTACDEYSQRQACRPTGIRFPPLSTDPGLATAPDSAAAQLLALPCGCDEFGTEGGLFSQAGIATVVCGPGSMEQGHKPDEFVSIEQLAECDALLGRLVEWLQQGAQ